MSTEATSRTDATLTTTDRSLSTDDTFHLLQNARRRAALRYISGHADECGHADESAFEMREIADQVAAWENDKPVAQITSSERQRVYIALYQNHLPKLDDAGVIDYNQSRGIVEATPLLETVEPYLTAGSAADPSAAERSTSANADSLRYYGGATLLSVVLFAASTLGLAPAVVAGSLATVITGLFTVITVGLTYQM